MASPSVGLETLGSEALSLKYQFVNPINIVVINLRDSVQVLIWLNEA